MNPPLSSCCSAPILYVRAEKDGEELTACQKCMNVCSVPRVGMERCAEEPEPESYEHTNDEIDCPVCGIGFEHRHPDVTKPKEFEYGGIPMKQTGITDAERRQTYDYKMGWKEGMEEARRIVKKEQKKAWQYEDTHGREQMGMLIIDLINEKLCPKK
jgi:hypothetical protein